MRRVRSRLTILLLILVIVTSLFSLTFGALVRNGIIFQQRDNIRYLVFGYAAKDILLLLIAVAAVAVLITVTSRSTTNPIRELSRAAREIAGGNYDVTVPERDRVEEFGELERNFNLMTAELRSNEYLRKDFISSVSHQLKTPLSILNGYAQLLAEGGLSETEEREYSQYIAQESDRLVGLIDDMLRLSRIDHREIQRKAEIFPLGEQLRRTAARAALDGGRAFRLRRHPGSRLRRRQRASLSGMGESAGKRREVHAPRRAHRHLSCRRSGYRHRDGVGHRLRHGRGNAPAHF